MFTYSLHAVCGFVAFSPFYINNCGRRAEVQHRSSTLLWSSLQSSKHYRKNNEKTTIIFMIITKMITAIYRHENFAFW
jgi:hypothetical protein